MVRRMVISMTGTQIKKINPLVRYSHNIQSKKRDKSKSKSMWVSDYRSGVMISRCSAESQNGGLGLRPLSVGCSYFRYTNNKKQRNLAPERHRRKTKTKADKNNVI